MRVNFRDEAIPVLIGKSRRIAPKTTPMRIPPIYAAQTILLDFNGDLIEGNVINGTDQNTFLPCIE